MFEEPYVRCLLAPDLPDRVWDLIGGTINVCARSDAAFGLGSTVPPVEQALRHAPAVRLSNDNEISYGIDICGSRGCRSP